MTHLPTLYGAGASPFVRKVRLALAHKGIAHHHEPVMPFGVSDDCRRKSPLGKIPCWEDERGPLPDSSVILAYLERVHPDKPLLPDDPAHFGRALWLEEYADTRLAEAVGDVFFERVVKRLLRQETDADRVQRSLDEKLPACFDDLEEQVPGAGGPLVGGELSLADLAVGSQLANLRLAGETPDPARWPRLAAWAEDLHGRPPFAELLEEDRRSLGGR